MRVSSKRTGNYSRQFSDKRYFTTDLDDLINLIWYFEQLLFLLPVPEAFSLSNQKLIRKISKFGTKHLHCLVIEVEKYELYCHNF